MWETVYTDKQLHKDVWVRRIVRYDVGKTEIRLAHDRTTPFVPNGTSHTEDDTIQWRLIMLWRLTLSRRRIATDVRSVSQTAEVSRNSEGCARLCKYCTLNVWGMLDNTPLCRAVKIVVVIQGSTKLIKINTLHFVHCVCNPFHAHVFAHYGITWVISGLRREVNDMCAPLEYYAVYFGVYLWTLRDNLLDLIFKFSLIHWPL